MLSGNVRHNNSPPVYGLCKSENRFSLIKTVIQLDIIRVRDNIRNQQHILFGNLPLPSGGFCLLIPVRMQQNLSDFRSVDSQIIAFNL